MCLLKSCFFKENWNSLNLRSTKQSRAAEMCFSPPSVIFWKQRNLLKATSLDHLRRIAPGWRVPPCVEKWHQCERARESHGWTKCEQMHLLLPASVWTEPKDKHYFCFSRVCCHYRVHSDASPVGALLCTVSLFISCCVCLSFLFLLFDKTLNGVYQYINI